jgi:YgiT-type zinc finger domain-containing protein
MKCVICHGGTLITQKIQEEVKIGNDIILVPVEAQVCQTCGERYYSRSVMKYLEDIETKLKRKEKPLRQIGKILSFE